MQMSSGVKWFARLALMAVAIYLGSSYIIRVWTSRSAAKQRGAQTVPFHQTGDAAQFRLSLESGNQALRNGDKSTAMSSFQAAEQALEPLDDSQYQSLKDARVALAQAYQTSGEDSSADAVYTSLAECGIRDARTLLLEKAAQRALERAQDAEQSAEHSGNNSTKLQTEARDLIAGSFDSLQRFSDEAEVQRRQIDFLKATADEYSIQLPDSMYTLAQTYYKEKDWQAMEQTLASANEACDRGLSYYSGFSDPNAPNPAFVLLFRKNAILHDLVVAYYQQGQIDEALSKADELFVFASSHEPSSQGQLLPHGQPVPPVEAARLGLELAKEARNAQATQIWEERARQLGVSFTGKNSGITIIDPSKASTTN